ncbi:hypothetical protein [Niastella sp. OAS944]|uniref:hypothetical protein n=1 Tax=Niastella sp. OAS944 TaxID=2664089 RepID=UPI00346CCECE|nr:hypothetical protein [Chitinophagaceae bacterium OAS944]
MRQIKLKMLVGKLGLLSIYLLFLSVQLNLKYTFSDSIFSDYPGANTNTKTGVSVERSGDNKSTVQKLRLNKRYVHQEVFLIEPFGVQGITKYYIKVNETFLPIPLISGASVCHALLRGPPASSLSC